MQHKRPALRFIGIALLVVAVIYLLQPHSLPPRHLNNICAVFQSRPQWYSAAKQARKKWGIPISTQMAIIFRESHFRAGAKPTREKLLGLIPWFRSTTAEGYAQAVDPTWRRYLHETHQHSADRNDFDKATDFVGWYLQHIHRQLNIPIHDVFHLYLAYHEGTTGYQKGSYRHQKRLIAIAHHVSWRAARYQQQLLSCR